MTSTITIATAIDATLDAITALQKSAADTKTTVSFAETLSAVPLFSSWTPANLPYPAVSTSSSNSIATTATTNRRHEGRRRSSH